MLQGTLNSVLLARGKTQPPCWGCSGHGVAVAVQPEVNPAPQACRERRSLVPRGAGGNLGVLVLLGLREGLQFKPGDGEDQTEGGVPPGKG